MCQFFNIACSQFSMRFFARLSLSGRQCDCRVWLGFKVCFLSWFDIELETASITRFKILSFHLFCFWFDGWFVTFDVSFNVELCSKSASLSCTRFLKSSGTNFNKRSSVKFISGPSNGFVSRFLNRFRSAFIAGSCSCVDRTFRNSFKIWYNAFFSGACARTSSS